MHKSAIEVALKYVRLEIHMVLPTLIDFINKIINIFNWAWDAYYNFYIIYLTRVTYIGKILIIWNILIIIIIY